jgi:hypothetical protein
MSAQENVRDLIKLAAYYHEALDNEFGMSDVENRDFDEIVRNLGYKMQREDGVCVRAENLTNEVVYEIIKV